MPSLLLARMHLLGNNKSIDHVVRGTSAQSLPAGHRPETRAAHPCHVLPATSPSLLPQQLTALHLQQQEVLQLLRAPGLALAGAWPGLARSPAGAGAGTVRTRVPADPPSSVRPMSQMASWTRLTAPWPHPCPGLRGQRGAHEWQRASPVPGCEAPPLGALRCLESQEDILPPHTPHTSPLHTSSPAEQVHGPGDRDLHPDGRQQSPCMTAIKPQWCFDAEMIPFANTKDT